MACTCGSQKQSTAPTSINTVNIGVLCFLFGIEGILCQILDLVPEAIKAIVSVNPDKGNADDIFQGLLKKVAKTGYGIVIDEVTGNIDLTSFCSSPPPPIPEDITYYDIYAFIGELVPILERFFKINDVLVGNSTKLLDKVVGFWLYKQWFENCECSPCPPPPEPPPEPPNERPEFTIPNDCDDGSSRCKNLRLTGAPYNPQIIGSCYGFWVYTNTQLIEPNNPLKPNDKRKSKHYIPLEYTSSDYIANPNIGLQFSYKTEVYNVPPRTDVTAETITSTNGNATFYASYSNEGIISGWDLEPSISNDGNNWKKYEGNSDGYLYPPCPPPPPPSPPPEFCELFPTNPICNSDQDDCDREFVVCGEFIDCNSLLRKPVTRSLIKAGDVKEVSVTEFIDCESPHATKQIEYLECSEIDPPITGCTDPNASNYNPNAQIDDGSCEYYGCKDPTALNYNPYAQIDDGSCIQRNYGCTDPNASNYNPNANTDDGSCEYYGCTDPNALNYNANAQIDDGSCYY